jgi:hypothetical protein
VVKILDERESSDQNFLALITFSRRQYDRIFDKKNASKSGSFVIHISKITSSNPSIKVDEGNNGEDTYTYSHLSDGKDETISIFYGEIIDFYLDKIKNWVSNIDKLQYMNSKISSVINLIIALGVVMALLVGVTSIKQYSYYIFLRWLVMTVFIYFSYESYKKNKPDA